MAYNNSRGGSGDRPAKRSFGSDRPSSGEGKKIFNRNDKGRASDSRDRKPYGDSPRGDYGGKPRSERPYNAERSDRPYNKERGSDRPYNADRSFNKDRSSGSDRPYNKDRAAGSDRPYNKERGSDRPYNADRPYNKDRGFKSDRPYENRSSDRPSRSEGGDKEFRPYRPATRKPTDDRPWVARAERSGQGSVPRGGKGERNRSFKPEKEEYRKRQEEKGHVPHIGSKKSYYGQKPNPADLQGDVRTPYVKKRYDADDKKSFGSSDRGFSKDRGFNKEERGGNRFTPGMRASREGQGKREGFVPRETRAPREERFNKEENFNPEAEGEFRPYRPNNDTRSFREERGAREDRPAREERAPREERGGRPDRYAERQNRMSREDVGEAPNYSGLKRYAGRDKNRSEDLSADGQLRLNRYIANAGICSRREADELIAAGEIRVNGEVVTELGYKVKPTDSVQYGKKNLSREKLVYVLLNKPKDFITTTEDPEGRKTVMDLVKNASKERIFPVGRLDRNTTGLLLFTNDGELAQKLTHPSHKNSKIYQVELDKPITKEDFQKISEGLELEDGKAIVDDLALIGNTNKFLGIEIHIGRNRIVRRIFESLGYEVVTLDRVQYAGLTKKDLPRGNWRFLSEKEVIRLKYFL